MSCNTNYQLINMTCYSITPHRNSNNLNKNKISRAGFPFGLTVS